MRGDDLIIGIGSTGGGTDFSGAAFAGTPVAYGRDELYGLPQDRFGGHAEVPGLSRRNCSATGGTPGPARDVQHCSWIEQWLFKVPLGT